MNDKQIEYFYSIVQNGTFSNASRNLYISQQALSSSIKSLENELNCSLFDREHTKKISLTQEGKYFLDFCQKYFSARNDLSYHLQRYHSLGEETIELYLFVNPTFSYLFINELIKFLSFHCPNIRVVERVESTNDIYTFIDGNQKNMLAIMNIPFTSGEIPAHYNPTNDYLLIPVLTNSLVACVSAFSPLAKTIHPLSIKELAKYPAVFFSNTDIVNCTAYQIVKQYTDINVQFVSNNFLSLVKAIEKNIYIYYLYDYYKYCYDQEIFDKFRFIQIKENTEVAISLYYKKNDPFLQQVASVVKLFIEQKVWPQIQNSRILAKQI